MRFLYFLSMVIFAISVNAHELKIDSTFGVNNLAATPLVDMILTPVVSKDASIFIAGRVERNGALELAIVKVTSIGTMDSLFADSGVMVLPTKYDDYNLVGLEYCGVKGFALVFLKDLERTIVAFDEWGRQRSTFGVNGELIIGEASGQLKVTSTNLGKIMVYIYDEGLYDLYCYNEMGQLDSGYGNGGSIWNFYDPGNKFVIAQSTHNGGMAIAGNARNMMQYGTVIVQHNDVGDVVFGCDYYPLGVWHECIPSQIYDLKNGGYLIKGTTYVQDTTTFSWHYLEAFYSLVDDRGSRETSFGNNGYMQAYNSVTIDSGTFIFYEFISIWPDGILVEASQGFNTGYLLMNLDGSFDSAFFQTNRFGHNDFQYRKSIPFRDSSMYVFGKSTTNGNIVVGKFGDPIAHVSSRPSGDITSVKQVNKTVQMLIQPNPINSQSEINVEGLEGEKARLTIFNINGQIVHDVTRYCSNGQIRYPIPYEKLNKGMYTVVVRSNEKVLSQKLIR